MNNRKLSLVFVILLLGVWGISKIFSKGDAQSFQTDLISIDTALVTIIKIDPKGEEETEMTLQRNTTSRWLATKGTVTATANIGIINSFLNRIQLIQTEKVAAKEKEKWSDYEVDELNGTRIKIYTGSQLLEDFIVGGFNLNQETNQGLSFVRISGGDEVYAIDGFLRKSLGQGFNAYRNKRVVKTIKEDITALSLTKEDGAVLSFIKKNNQWRNDSLLIDSVAISNYLSGIQNVMGSTFVDDIDPTTYSLPKYRTLVITNSNISQPISITCYRDEAKMPPYIIQSSQNMESYFSSEESDLFQKIFGALDLLPHKHIDGVEAKDPTI